MHMAMALAAVDSVELCGPAAPARNSDSVPVPNLL